MTFEQLVSEIRQMSIDERKQLIAAIVDTFVEEKPTKRRSILEFEGIGERLRDDMDAQDYVNKLRSEWDERP
jgi:hypothetical protein